MRRYEFTDTYDNSVRVTESGNSGDKQLWLFVERKGYENNEVKYTTVGSCLTLNQAKILIASLQDMVDALEKKV